MRDFLPIENSPVIEIGPFISETDGKTILDSLTILAANIKISKNYGALVAKSPLGQEDPPQVVYDSFGMYRLQLSVEDVDTLGRFEIFIHVTGALPVKHVYEVRKLYTIRVLTPDGTGTMTPVPGDYSVFEGENFNVLGTPTGGGVVVTDIMIDGSSVGASAGSNIDDLAARYYAFLNVGRSAKIRFFFGGGA